MIRVVPNAGVKVASIRVPFRAICRFVIAPFEGVATITYRPGKFMPEYNDVERFARSLEHEHLTHEEVTVKFIEVFASLECPVRVDVDVKSAAHPDVWAMVGDDSLPKGGW